MDAMDLRRYWLGRRTGVLSAMGQPNLLLLNLTQPHQNHNLKLQVCLCAGQGDWCWALSLVQGEESPLAPKDR